MLRNLGCGFGSHECCAGRAGGAGALWRARFGPRLAGPRAEKFHFPRGCPPAALAPSRPFPDAREVMINSGLALSPASAPRAHTLGRPLPTVPSDAGSVCPCPPRPGVRAPRAALVNSSLGSNGNLHQAPAQNSPPGVPAATSRGGVSRRNRAQPASLAQLDVGGAGYTSLVHQTLLLGKAAGKGVISPLLLETTHAHELRRNIPLR